jgi:general secretion pathway protein B
VSFILDALRKSESERRQDARPTIARIPDALPSRRVPLWALATMITLGVGVVVLAGAWLHTLMTPPPAPAATAAGGAPARVEPLPLPREGHAQGVAPTAGAPRSPNAMSPGVSAALDAAGATARTPLAPSAAADNTPTAAADGRTRLRNAASLAPEPSFRPSSYTTARPALPTLEASPASYTSTAPSLGLPALRLELLAYAEDPLQRFVFINGRRYKEGDTLPEGPRVIGINSRGAVLLAQGRQLQLDQH